MLLPALLYFEVQSRDQAEHFKKLILNFYSNAHDPLNVYHREVLIVPVTNSNFKKNHTESFRDLKRNTRFMFCRNKLWCEISIPLKRLKIMYIYIYIFLIFL